MVPVAIFRNLKIETTADLKFFTKITYRNFIYYSLSIVRLATFKLQEKIYEKFRRSTLGEVVMVLIHRLNDNLKP